MSPSWTFESRPQAFDGACVLGEASLQPINELGVQTPTRPVGRGFQLLAKALWHPEQEAIPPLSHEAPEILHYLGADIKSPATLRRPDINAGWSAYFCGGSGSLSMTFDGQARTGSFARTVPVRGP
jgi:hypothetical protein